MKTLLAVGSCVLFASLPCSGQRRGSGGVSFVGTGGYGNVAFPGTGGPNANFATRLGNTVAGRQVGSVRGVGAGQVGRQYGGGGYPVFVGGAYVPAYAPDYSGQTQLAPQQQQYAAPPVIINQYFGNPAALEPVTEPRANSTFYQPSSERRQAYEEDRAAAAPKFYLLAFKDHSVYSASAYWIEDKTLHYVTPQNTHNQASLDLVDLPFTKQLNQDRDVPFSPQPQ